MSELLNSIWQVRIKLPSNYFFKISSLLISNANKNIIDYLYILIGNIANIINWYL